MKNLQILFPKDIRFYLQEFLPICACEALLSNFFFYFTTKFDPVAWLK